MKKGRIDFIDNLLSDSNIVELTNIVENFTPSRTPDETGNYYFNTYVDIANFTDFLNSVKSYYNSISNKYLVEIEAMWINKVDSTSNKNDVFHNDQSRLSTVTLLNDNYEGGHFNYFNEKEEEVSTKCKKYTTLIFDGQATGHRVLPVTKGVRFSLVTFWQTKIKTTKTLL